MVGRQLALKPTIRKRAEGMHNDGGGSTYRSMAAAVLYGPHNEELYAVVWSAEAAPQCFDDLQIKTTELPSRPATITPTELVPQTVTIRSNKQWLEWAVQNVSSDDRKHGWKKRYATKLLAKMDADAKSNKKIKPPQQYTSIAARLNEYSLWPEIDDEKTTK